MFESFGSGGGGGGGESNKPVSASSSATSGNNFGGMDGGNTNLMTLAAVALGVFGLLSLVLIARK